MREGRWWRGGGVVGGGGAWGGVEENEGQCRRSRDDLIGSGQWPDRAYLEHGLQFHPFPPSAMLFSRILPDQKRFRPLAEPSAMKLPDQKLFRLLALSAMPFNST